MSDENKNNGTNPGNTMSDKADKLIGKSKELADQAEDYLVEKASQVKKSDAFAKISGLFDKVENFIEDKSEEYHSGEMGAKIEAFRDKAEEHANDLLKKAKEAGRKFGDQVDESIDSIKGKKDRANNQNGGGI